MANESESVDSNGNNCGNNDLRPRRSSRAKGKQINSQTDESEDHIVVNNVAYKIGDFVYYFDKKQDVFRIGLIEELKFQKRDKLSNKKAEITLKQFFRLDEVPASVLSNQGEYDTHVMPQNFPDWLRQREIFITDNTLSVGTSTVRGLCTVRHFPDLNHAMVLFSSAPTAAASSPAKLDHHSLLIGKDPGSSLPVVPRHRDDNTFFYVFSYNPRGRKLAATYLEIRVGGAYQAELPELRDDPPTEAPREILLWRPGQIPEEVHSVYQMATFSLSCFSGFGGGVDDSASIENGRKIASHMLTQQRALDCLHRCNYNMEKAVDSFAENALPEPSKVPFLWTDEDHQLFDESVKVHGKNFLRIKQDKRNKKNRTVGDFVTFYYFWKKNRPKNRKYTAKKMLRSRISLQSSNNNNNNNENSNVAQDPNSKMADSTKLEPTTNDKMDGTNLSPSDGLIEHCSNCECALPKIEEVEEKPITAPLSDRLRNMCEKCQSYFRRYGYQRPTDLLDKRLKTSDGRENSVGGANTGLENNLSTNITDDNNDIDDDDEDDEDGDADDDEDNEDESSVAQKLPSVKTNPLSPVPTVKEEKLCAKTNSSSNNIAAINKYDFDQEDENVEEVSSLLKRSQAKHSLVRESDIKPFKTSAGIFSGGNKSLPSTPTSKQLPQSSQFHKLTDSKPANLASDAGAHLKSNKRSCSFSKRSHTNTPNSVGDVTSTTAAQSGSSKRRRTHHNTPPETKAPSTAGIMVPGKLAHPQLQSGGNRNTPTHSQQQQSHNKKSQNTSTNQRRLHQSPHITSKSSTSATNPAGGGVSSNQKQRQRHMDSNSSASSSSFSSNDSSSSSDDIEDVPLAKRTTAVAAVATIGNIGASTPTPLLSNQTVNTNAASNAVLTVPQLATAPNNVNKSDLKIQRLDLPTEAPEPTYNQMITSTPNIPGVCAVTEPELLSQSTRKPPQPHPPSLPNPQSAGPNNPSPLTDVKNYDGSSLSQQHQPQLSLVKQTDSQGNEDMILNLVKKRVPPSSMPHQSNSPVPLIPAGSTITTIANEVPPSSLSSVGAGGMVSTATASNLSITQDTAANPTNPHNYWMQRHEEPSKLVHHRGDSALMGSDGNINLQEIVPKKMVNGLELLHRSKFGLLLRTPKPPGDDSCCSRVDLRHSRAELTETELEARQRYIDAKKKQQASDAQLQSQQSFHQHAHHSIGQPQQQQPQQACQATKSLPHSNMLPPSKHQQQPPPVQQQTKKLPPSIRTMSPHHQSVGSSSRNPLPSASVSAQSITPPNLGAVRQQAVRPPTVPPQNPQSVPPSHSQGVNPLLMDFISATKMPNDYMLYQNFGQMPMSNEDLIKQDRMKMLSVMSSIQQQHQTQQQQQQMVSLNRHLLGAMAGVNAGQSGNAGSGSAGPTANLASLGGHNSAIADLLLQSAYQQQQQQQQQTVEQHLFNLLRCFSGSNPSVNQPGNQQPQPNAAVNSNRPRSAAGSLDKQQQQQPQLQESELCDLLRVYMANLAPDQQQQHLQSLGLQQGWMNPGGSSAGGSGISSSSSCHHQHPAHVSSNSNPPPPQHHPNQHPPPQPHPNQHQKPPTNNNPQPSAAAQSFQNLGIPGNAAPAAHLLQQWQQFTAFQQQLQQQSQQQPPSSNPAQQQQARQMQPPPPSMPPNSIPANQLEFYQMIFNSRR